MDWRWNIKTRATWKARCANFRRCWRRTRITRLLTFMPAMAQWTASTGLRGLARRFHQLHLEQRVSIYVLQLGDAVPIRIRNTAVQVTVAFVAVLILIGAFFNIDFIRRDSGVAVRWNGSEADLFVYASVRGFETSYLLYPWSLAREFFYVPPPANHLNDWLIVFRITPAGIERHAVKPEDRGPGSGPGELTPIDGQIYANYPAIGGLCRWAGD